MNTITEILEQENLIAFLIEVNDEDRILEKGFPEGEAEIARYHRVSNNQYDMNRSEKIKC